MCCAPVWCDDRGPLRPPACSASAAGTSSLSACAPRLPPTTSRRSGPAASGEALLRARGSAAIVGAHRVADPLDGLRVVGRAARRESRASTRRRPAPAPGWRGPATAFGSCSTSGLPSSDAIMPPGNDDVAAHAEHDVGRGARMIARALCQKALEQRAAAEQQRAHEPLPRTPRNEMRSNATPCWRHELALHALRACRASTTPSRARAARRRPRGPGRRGRRCRRP